MEMVNIDDAKEGMIVSEEILNEQGNVLVKVGTILTEDLIKNLKRFNHPLMVNTGLRVAMTASMIDEEGEAKRKKHLQDKWKRFRHAHSESKLKNAGDLEL